MSTNDNHRPSLWRYRLILSSLSLIVLFYTLYRSFKDGGSNYFLQRFGFSLPHNTVNSTWVHCASVGEINTALPLVRALIKHQPDTKIVISTTTPTGKDVLLTRLPNNTTHFYLPLDFNFVVKRTLKKISPRQLILVETELWPNLIQHCETRRIPVSIVNARLSHKTQNTYPWLLAAYRHSLNLISTVYAKNKNEGDKFLKLGLPIENLHIVGSLKFAPAENSPQTANSLPERPYWLAASTHDDEEHQIVTEWYKKNRNELLVIAPRHPDRRNKLTTQLNAIGPSVQLRSQQKALKPDTKVYIVDTLGELDGFIQEALLVFVGGSLIPRGGHNIVEAARVGKAVVTGPSIENFSDEFQWLSEQEAIVQVQNKQQLIKEVCDLLDRPSRRANLANNAASASASQSDVIDRYVALLSEKIGTG